MQTLLKVFLFIGIFLAANPAPAQTPDTAQPRHVHIRLVPERGAVKAGEELWIGIEQSIESGWHTYWKNPGDSGTAPIIAWTLPQDFTISDIHWPVPHKMPMGPLMNYGYENNVILLQKLKIPGTLPEGPINLKANIDILVCQEICIPESSTYELTLNGTESENENNIAYFDQARTHLPVAASWNATFKENDGFFHLILPPEVSALKNAEFFPEDFGFVKNSSAQERKDNTIIQQRGERPIGDITQTNGLLAYDDEAGARRAYMFTAYKDGITPPLAKDEGRSLSLPKILFFALLGGLILNLMPCVFPVLTLKVLSLVKISEKSPALARAHGLSYTAGIVFSFIAIAALLIALRAAGSGIGWGFQLQNSAVVTLLAYLFFIIGLNLMGAFEISGALGNVGNKLTQGTTLKSSFFTGMLAAIVATPCTAPFMAAAIGAALTQPPALALVIFGSLGFGLALPYLALSFAPALQKFLPRPGAWMETFRHVLALPMLLSSLWLLWVLHEQTTAMVTLGAVMGMTLIAIGLRLLAYKRRALSVLLFIAALAMVPASIMIKKSLPPVKTPAISSHTFGEVWTPEKLEEKLAGNDPVFVEMTAAWCITCKVNHAVAIDVPSTRKVFTDANVQYLIGDWTKQDPAITKYLNSYGRNGVPIYVYYGARGTDGQRPEPVLLPQLLTPGIVAGTIK